MRKNKLYNLSIGLILVLFTATALLLNLNELPINMHSDESRRALVILEMIISQQWFNPTINGMPYYNKPAVYNWIMIPFQTIFKDSLMGIRVPMLLSLLLSVSVVYQYNKRKLSTQVAIFAGLIYLSSGRILFYDSLLGLIDIAYSLVLLLGSYQLYNYYFEKRKWALFKYFLLIGIAFLMKGFSAPLFMLLSLIAVHIQVKELHLKTIKTLIFNSLGFLLPTLPYYFFTFLNSSLSLTEAFSTLFSESAVRATGNFSVQERLTHFISFPLELIYHFAPFTIAIPILLYIFFKDNRQISRIIISQKETQSADNKQVYIKFLVYQYLINALPFWIATQVYPRYLFIHLLLIAPVLAYYLLEKWRSEIFLKYYRLSSKALLLLMIISLLSTAGYMLYQQEYILGFICAGLSVIAYIIRIFQPKLSTFHYSLWIILALLGFRILFNIYVIPARNEVLQSRLAGLQDFLAKYDSNHPLYIYQPNYASNAFRYEYFPNVASYYITRHTNQIILTKEDFTTPGDYLVKYAHQIPREGAQLLGEISFDGTSMFWVRIGAGKVGG